MKSEIERQENKEKTGVFTGAYAANPANGEKIPIWVADYVLTGYGTGAIMAVPAHDERDNEFAQKFDLPVKRVVQNDASDGECTHDEGNMMNSGSYDGLSTSQAREKIVADLEKQGVAKEKVQYKMRDWLISRQRYWGAPIPIIHCPKDGAVAVPEKDLPVVLPEVKSFEPRTVRGTVSVDASEASSKKQEAVSAFVPTGEGSVLATATDWVHTTCPKCGGEAMRETDTMDGYACSSWYFLRYADPKNDQQAWDPAIANYWLPVDYYCGGDHAVSHLLYTRFWFHFFADQGLIEKTRREPVGKLVYNGYILAPDGTKMSKSKGNTINPDDLIEQGYGADSVRLFEMFIAPYEQNTSWNTNGVPGTYRFLQRIWTLVQEFNESDSAEPGAQNQESTELKRLTHKTIKRVSGDLEHLSFNTAVAAMMECVNELYKIKAKDGYDAREDWQFALASLTQLLAPFAPHIAEELWQSLGGQGSVHVANWPAHDEQYLVADAMTLAVQINGKVRAEITVATDAGEDDIKKAALAHERVQGLLGGSEPKRIIYVPGRLVNIVS